MLTILCASFSNVGIGANRLIFSSSVIFPQAIETHEVKNITADIDANYRQPGRCLWLVCGDRHD